MAGKPAEPRRANDAQAGEPVDAQGRERAAGRGDGSGAEPERFGPLAVERLRKPDGRALILYRDERRDEGA